MVPIRRANRSIASTSARVAGVRPAEERSRTPATRVVLSRGIISGAIPSMSLRMTWEVANDSMSLSRTTAAMKEIESDSIVGVGGSRPARRNSASSRSRDSTSRPPAVGVVDYDHTAFELIGQVGRTQVGPGCLEDSRFKSIQDVLAEAKARPETITVAMNIGLLPHFVPLMFQQDAGVRFRYVQSGGGAVRLKSILGKHTELSLFSGPEFLLFKSQGIRPLVMFSEERVPELSSVPTAKEIGVPTVFEERVIVFAPRGAPRVSLDVVARALRAAMEDPEVAARYKGLGIDGVFIEGPRLKSILDGLKGPITKVGDVVKQAQAEQKKK